MRIRLHEIAHARSGDKGDASNVGLIARSDELFQVLRREVTVERVKDHGDRPGRRRALCRASGR